MIIFLSFSLHRTHLPLPVALALLQHLSLLSCRCQRPVPTPSCFGRDFEPINFRQLFTVSLLPRAPPRELARLPSMPQVFCASRQSWHRVSTGLAHFLDFSGLDFVTFLVLDIL